MAIQNKTQKQHNNGGKPNQQNKTKKTIKYRNENKNYNVLQTQEKTKRKGPPPL